jgi:O-antigen/teichoic acid export membrane protein
MSAETMSVEGVAGRVVSGLRWKIVSQLLQQVSRSAVAIVVAHLLSPADFGLAAMALVWSGVATLFSDVALGTALIQRQTITEEDRSTVFWMQVGLGVLVTALGVALAPTAASFFSTPRAAPYLAATASIALISGLGLTQMALLTRAMDFRSLELRMMTATGVSGAVALGLAVAGAGAWAIVGQAIGFAVTSTALVWRLSSWRPRWIFSKHSLRTLGVFGSKVMVSRTLGFLNLNVDNILIGRYLGAAALGSYTVAYNVMFLPIARIAQPIQQVLLPAFARLQNDPLRLGHAWLRGNRLVATIGCPAFVGMIVVAPDFVPAVLGQKWHAAIPVLQLLSLAGFAQSLQSLNPIVLQGLGQPGLLLRFMIFSTTLVVGSFALGLIWGVVGVAGLFAVARAIQLVGYTWLTARVTGLRPAEIADSFLKVVVLSAAVGSGAYLVRLALLQTGASQGVRLAAVTLTGVGLYLGFVAWKQRDLLVDVRTLLRRHR